MIGYVLIFIEMIGVILAMFYVATSFDYDYYEFYCDKYGINKKSYFEFIVSGEFLNF